jgi:probable DNA metabolism protein
MMDYLYDGSFSGLLTCIHENYYGVRAGGIYPAADYQVSIITPFKLLATDEKKAMAVYEGIQTKISEEALERIYRVHLSWHKEKENIILAYVRLGFKKGSCISAMHAHPVVLAMQDLDHKVSFEKVRLLGLIRFSEINNLLYCAVEPDHDVLELMADHFADRFKNENLIIFDKRRHKAIFCAGGKWYIFAFSPDEIPGFEQEEKRYQILWKAYFEHIAIKERINPRCQKRCMPVRYWKNLTEIGIMES